MQSIALLYCAELDEKTGQSGSGENGAEGFALKFWRDYCAHYGPLRSGAVPSGAKPTENRLAWRMRTWLGLGRGWG